MLNGHRVDIYFHSQCGNVLLIFCICRIYICGIFHADEVVGGKQAILDALKVFEEKTCLKFKPHTNESNWIIFKRLSGYEFCKQLICCN